MTRLYRLYLPLLWDELKLKSDESTSSVLAMSLWRWQRLPSCLCALEKLSTSTNFCTNFFPYESAGLTKWSIPMRGMNGMNRNEYESMNGFTQSHGCTLPYFAIVYCLFQHVSMFATREMSPMSPWGWNASGCWESALVWPKQGQKQRRRSLRQQISTDFNSCWTMAILEFQNAVLQLSSHNLTHVMCLRIMSWGRAKSKLRGSSATRGGWTRRIRRAATLCSKGGF